MAVSSLNPISVETWNVQFARHLLNRAGFGVPPERIDFLARLEPVAAVDFLVNYESHPNSFPEPDFLLEPVSREELRMEATGMSQEERRRAQRERQQAEREAINRLKAWWLARMLKTERPLEEKMTLFWHGHFATSAQKVKSSWHTYALNDVFRKHATGNFKALTIAVGQSPNMLFYLDNLRSTRQHPNENWARELMELFTMGQGHYTEDDIKESARAFTGWSADRQKFVLRDEIHDHGAKSFLGRRGNFDGWDIIDIIFEQPVTAEFICRKLWTFFAYPEPEEAISKGLAQTLRDARYDLKPVLKQMFLSQGFYSVKALGTQIKSPVQFAIQLCSHLKMDPPPYPMLVRGTSELGQNLFYPPNVKGWDGNEAWINANTLLLRYNAPVALAAGRRAGGRMREMMPQQQPAMLDPEMRAMTEDEGARLAEWSPKNAIANLNFRNAGECVDQLANRFLSVPLSSEQKRLLLDALDTKDPSTPLSPESVPEPQLGAALHLLLSTAEYQLC